MTTTVKSEASYGALMFGATEAIKFDGTGMTSGYGPLSIPAMAIAQKLTLGTAVATTSGTAIDFTGIPSWAKRITLIASGISTNSTSEKQIQLGSGTVSTSGYLGARCITLNASAIVAVNLSSGFLLAGTSASDISYALATFCLLGSNIWQGSVTGAFSSSAATFSTVGSITLSGTLDRIRLTTVNGTDLFDAGSVNILYEG